MAIAEMNSPFLDFVEIVKFNKVIFWHKNHDARPLEKHFRGVSASLYEA